MKSILNIILLPVFLLYRLIIILRNYLYDKKFLKTHKLPCKVICVGNISSGGTGKTPTVIELAKILQAKGKSVAILSRGYRRQSIGTVLVSDGKTTLDNWQDCGDEPLLMSRKLNNIPIVVDENRVRGGQFLVQKFNPEIIILDDGFQHRKIFRDIDIVLLDSSCSKINFSFFSFNYSRETWRALKRAHIVLLTKSNINQPNDQLINKINSLKVPFYKTTLEVEKYILNAKGEQSDSKLFKGKSAVIFSGIGEPDSFSKIVESLEIVIISSIKFRDHRQYSKTDLEKIHAKFISSGADIILTTEKDLLKINEPEWPLYSIPISIRIDENAIEYIYNLL